MSEEYPNPKEVRKGLMKLKTPEQQYDYVESQIQGIPENTFDEVFPNPWKNFDENVQTFTEITDFYDKWYHGLLHGRTGAGKTTLLATMLKKFLDRENTVLLRDDGGLEFRYLAAVYPADTRVFIPEGCDIEFKGFNAHKYKFEDAEDLLKTLGEDPYPFNVMTYDVFCLDPGLAGAFYGDLFTTLIYKCMRRDLKFRNRLVFAIMELNDIIQPRGFNITKEHAKVRPIIEYNIRKLRKFNVKLLAEVHRFNMIGINVRSQFDYTFIKKSYGFDVWDYLSKSLVTSNNKTFWAVLKKITTLPPWNFVMFDHDNHFDFYRFGDIPRPKVTCQAKGIVKHVTEEELTRQQEYCRVALVYKHHMEGMTEFEIAHTLDITKRQVQRIKTQLRSNPTLLEDIPIKQGQRRDIKKDEEEF